MSLNTEAEQTGCSAGHELQLSATTPVFSTLTLSGQLVISHSFYRVKVKYNKYMNDLTFGT